MSTELESLVQLAETQFNNAQNLAAIDEAKAQFLGKTGPISNALKAMASLSPEEKKTQGAQINKVKIAIETALEARRSQLADEAMAKELAKESLDISLPGRARHQGGLHPISLSIERIEGIFSAAGFDIADGPEIETDWFSFTSLNNPENHPARSMQDTFYLALKDEHGKPLNLRPHTSPMQVRYAQSKVAQHKASGSKERMTDIKVIAPGRTYRVDNDATHSPMFHQCECLWLGTDISFANLKVVLTNFFKAFFETDDLMLRFRPSFFPFTEPSAEVDIAFSSGPLKGRWLEVAGSGQVHPEVIKNFGLDPEEWIGFAFGMGLDRLTMLRYGVNDLRLFFDGDIRFLSQFN